jgi:tRNA(fMet)-specific endonuclease VapC
LKYLLDTNVLVDYLNGRHPSVVRKVHECSPGDLALTTIVAAELRCGADRSARPRFNHARLDVLLAEIPVLDFDLEAATSYGRVRALLEKRGVPIGPNDTLIAAQALARNLVVVTDNTSEFARIRGLKVENWREGGRRKG